MPRESATPAEVPPPSGEVPARGGRLRRLARSWVPRLVRWFPMPVSCPDCPERIAPLSRRAAGPLAPEFPIDLVYTWVDGDDPAHRARRFAYGGEPAAAAPAPLAPPVESLGDHRFRDSGELRYSLRSAAACAPWARRIFIVTDRQRPAWLDAGHDKIRIVDHTEIIPEQYLPTFNSHVIEAFLHRIPGLAEHYVYFNDDFFFARPCAPAEFFTANGLPFLFVDWRDFRREGFARLGHAHGQSFFNVVAYLREHGLPVGKGIVSAHTPHPQTRENAAGAFEFFRKAILAFAGNRFRGNGEMAFYSHALPMWAHATGRAVAVDERYYYVFSRREDRWDYYHGLLAGRGKGEAQAPFFCLNEGMAPTEPEHLADLRELLQRLFPDPSPYERRD